MADRWAVAAGNWSNTATWNGGTLPTAADDVWSNSFVVTIDQDITVLTLRHNSGTGITAGGYFSISGAGGPYTINITTPVLSGHLSASATTGLLSLGGSALVTVNCSSISGGATSQNNKAIVMNSGYTGTLTVNGNVTANVGYGIHNNSPGALIVNGTVTGNAASSFGIYDTGPGTTRVNGSVAGGTGNASHGFSHSAAATGGFTLNGSGVPGTGTPSHGANLAGNTINYFIDNGNSYGSASVTTRVPVFVGSPAQLNVSGTLIGGVVGAIVLGSTGAFIRVDATLIWSTTGVPPIDGGGAPVQFRRTGTELNAKFPSNDTYPTANANSMVTLSRYNTSNPAPGNVRAGTTYGPSNINTGTYVVPARESVSYGVPVDNTTGLAITKGADVAAITGAQIEAALDGY